MNVSYYETVIAVPASLGSKPYKQHQWLSAYLDSRGKINIPHHFKALSPSVPAIHLRSLEPVTDSSVLIEYDIKAGDDVTIYLEYCVSSNISKGNRTDKIGKQVETFPSPENMHAVVLKRLMAKTGLAGEIVEISSVKKTHIGKHAKGFIPSVDVIVRGVIHKPELYKLALEQGIGKKRAFGMGMIMAIDNG
ncbi:MAG: hypothetical protein RPS47_11675 [Colwellia sp.]